MTTVPKISEMQNIKNLLGYAVKNRGGYIDDLRRMDLYKGRTIDEFKKTGFIEKDVLTEKGMTYKITAQGDMYFKELFGKIDYFSKRTKGYITRRFHK